MNDQQRVGLPRQLIILHAPIVMEKEVQLILRKHSDGTSSRPRKECVVGIDLDEATNRYKNSAITGHKPI